MDDKVSSLGMVHWVPSNSNVTCVVTMYGTIDTLVMLNSTNKSRSHYPSFVITMNVMSSFVFVKKSAYQLSFGICGVSLKEFMLIYNFKTSINGMLEGLQFDMPNSTSRLVLNDF